MLGSKPSALSQTWRIPTRTALLTCRQVFIPIQRHELSGEHWLSASGPNSNMGPTACIPTTMLPNRWSKALPCTRPEEGLSLDTANSLQQYPEPRRLRVSYSRSRCFRSRFSVRRCLHNVRQHGNSLFSGGCNGRSSRCRSS
jgi:hypothetical protein